jgi:hypothetical protein
VNELGCFRVVFEKEASEFVAAQSELTGRFVAALLTMKDSA